MGKELAKTYDPHGIEDRLYQKWLDKKYFHAEVDETKKPFTIVIPPPNITGQDVYKRQVQGRPLLRLLFLLGVQRLCADLESVVRL